MSLGIAQVHPKQLKSYHYNRGDILRPPGSSLSPTIVFRYKDIGGTGKLCTKHREKVMLLSKYSVPVYRNDTIFRSFINNIPPISL
jgi:hypothetical protein